MGTMYTKRVQSFSSQSHCHLKLLSKFPKELRLHLKFFLLDLGNLKFAFSEKKMFYFSPIGFMRM